MIRPSLFSGLIVLVCLLLTSNTGYAQLTGGNTGGGAGGNNNTGGLIGGNAGGGNTGGLIGADAATNQAVQDAIRATGNFQTGFGGGTTGGGGNRTTRQFGAEGNAGGGGAARGGGKVASTRRVIRPVLRIAFDYPLPGKRVDSTLNRHLDRVSIRLNNRFRTVGIEVGDKGVVTLKGEVQSEGDRKLAAAYVRLEPGVRKVENNLIVVVPEQP